MNSKLLKCEIGGAIFTVLLGSALHFTFQWSNKFWLVGLFSAVNESTFEHLKLAVIPAVLWMLLERKLLKLKPPNFFLAKALGIYSMPILIVVLFYGYTALLGTNYLFLDISVFVLSVLLGYLISYKIMTMPPLSPQYNPLASSLLALLVLSFFLFTFFPPQIFLFQDLLSGGYGIIK